MSIDALAGGCGADEMQLARDVADMIVFMADGRIVEQVLPRTLFANPTSDRLRTFLKRFHDAYLL